MRLIFASLLAFAAIAQTPPSEPATGSISGVVKDATTHLPLAGVRVYAGEASATTGPMGEFSVRGLQPGQHSISVYDQRRAGSGHAYVLLNAGQQLTGVELYANSGGSISGRVLDDEGAPVPGAAVILLRAQFESGEPAYGPSLTASTGAHGEYRLEPVAAGHSFLILAKMPIHSSAGEKPLPADLEKRPTIIAPAFYPASADAAAAQTVTVGTAEDRRGVDIRMARVTPYCIAGAVDTPRDIVASSVAIKEQFALTSDSTFAPVTAAVSEGRFRACGFHPGDYQLDSSQTEGPRSGRWWAKTRLSIADRDADDVPLMATGPVTIAGETVWEPAPRDQSKANVRVIIGLERGWSDGNADEAQPPSMMGSMVSYGGRIQVPGPFTLENSPANDYSLKLGELPAGCYVKQAAFGSANVLHQPLQLAQGAEGRLHIALACDGASLTARVTDRDGNPVSHVNLYVLPAEAPSAAALSDLLKQAEVQNGWSGIVQPLPPGKYLVLACDLELDGTAEPILKLWRSRPKAKEVEIGAGESAQVTLEADEDGL